jgi:hypothetical protein
MDFTLGPEISAHRELKLFEDILNSGLSLRVKATGRSMSPFLRGGEILTIKKVPSCSLRTGDLIFFKNHDGLPLIHRIVGKRSNSNIHLFQTKGDAVLRMDDPVSEHNIIGKVCGIEKKNTGDGIRFIDMRSGFWKTVNYTLAVISLGKSKIYSAVSRKRFYQ